MNRSLVKALQCTGEYARLAALHGSRVAPDLRDGWRLSAARSAARAWHYAQLQLAPMTHFRCPACSQRNA